MYKDVHIGECKYVSAIRMSCGAAQRTHALVYVTYIHIYMYKGDPIEVYLYIYGFAGKKSLQFFRHYTNNWGQMRLYNNG